MKDLIKSGTTDIFHQLVSFFECFKNEKMLFTFTKIVMHPMHKIWIILKTIEKSRTNDSFHAQNPSSHFRWSGQFEDLGICEKSKANKI